MPLLPRSTVGKKLVMGITGLVWIAFVVGHVLGNLLVFAGRRAMNAYASLLHASAEVLWGVRIVLIVALVLHVASAVSLTRADLAARPVAYARNEPQAATIASRTIRWSGVAILAFLVFHILHLTTGTIHPAPIDVGDAYGNVTRSFQIGWVAALYLVAMVLLGLHVFHGTFAVGKTLGLVRLPAPPFRRSVAIVIAGCVWVGFTAIPLAILTQVIR